MWDIREHKPIVYFKDIHYDTITSIDKCNQHQFASASHDGYVNVSPFILQIIFTLARPIIFIFTRPIFSLSLSQFLSASPYYFLPSLPFPNTLYLTLALGPPHGRIHQTTARRQQRADIRREVHRYAKQRLSLRWQAWCVRRCAIKHDWFAVLGAQSREFEWPRRLIRQKPVPADRAH